MSSPIRKCIKNFIGSYKWPAENTIISPQAPSSSAACWCAGTNAPRAEHIYMFACICMQICIRQLEYFIKNFFGADFAFNGETRVCIKRNINEWKKGKYRKEKWNYNEKAMKSLHGRNFCKAISITLRQLNWFSMVRHKINEKLREPEKVQRRYTAWMQPSEWVSETMSDSISCSTYSFLWLTRKQT